MRFSLSAQKEESKDSFFDDLQDSFGRAPTEDKLIVAEDWNARPGPVDMANKHTLGKFALGTKCANGDCLVSFTSANRIQDPQRHLVTWFSNDGHTRNPVDHILVQSRCACSMIDCPAYNWAEKTLLES